MLQKLFLLLLQIVVHPRITNVFYVQYIELKKISLGVSQTIHSQHMSIKRCQLYIIETYLFCFRVHINYANDYYNDWGLTNCPEPSCSDHCFRKYIKPYIILILVASSHKSHQYIMYGIPRMRVLEITHD